MSQTEQVPQTEAGVTAVVDWLTTMAIAAIAICLVQFIHEGSHALTCLLTGAELQEFSALHVSCQGDTVTQSKLVSASAAIVNILVGLLFLLILRRSRQAKPGKQFFIWLFMLLNWLLGAGYWMFSGIANVGDWANVIAGWQPHWLWRLVMTVAGAALYIFFVWLSLKEWGQIVGGRELKEQIGRATKLGILAYITIFLVILLAGLFNLEGITGLPAVAALLLALGGMSPLLWMMQWFRAKSFEKVTKDPLEIQRHWGWVITAVAAVFVYAIVLGRTLYF